MYTLHAVPLHVNLIVCHFSGDASFFLLSLSLYRSICLSVCCFYSMCSFAHRMRNKMWYFEFGAGEMLSASCRDLHEHISLEVIIILNTVHISLQVRIILNTVPLQQAFKVKDVSSCGKANLFFLAFFHCLFVIFFTLFLLCTSCFLHHLCLCHMFRWMVRPLI